MGGATAAAAKKLLLLLTVALLLRVCDAAFICATDSATDDAAAGGGATAVVWSGIVAAEADVCGTEGGSAKRADAAAAEVFVALFLAGASAATGTGG